MRTTRLTPVLIVTASTAALLGCAVQPPTAPSAADPTPVSSPTSDSPTPDSTASAPPQVPSSAPSAGDVHCLNVIAPAYRAGLLEAGLALVATGAQQGDVSVPNGGDGFEPSAPTTGMVWCVLAPLEEDVEAGGASEEIAYSTFDAADTDSVFEEYRTWALAQSEMHGGPEPSFGTVAGIDGARQGTTAGEDGSRQATIVGEGWMLFVRSYLGIDDLAAPEPDRTYGLDAFAADVPPTQLCETMLPPATPEFDALTAFGLMSAPTVESDSEIICSSSQNDDYQAALSWRDADAAAPSGGIGTTLDDAGTIVERDDGSFDVHFEDAVVTVRLDDPDAALELARIVHAPRWPSIAVG